MSAGAVKAGGVFVEIGADPRRFFATLNRVNKAMANMGRSLSSAGAKVGGIGVATLAPFAAAVRAGAGYQSTLLNIQASTGATATELDKLKTASMQMSAAMGKGPTEIATGFLALLKAGVSLEQVLGGVGQTALEFAAVGNLDVTAAAETMADAMKVFGVSSSVAANTLSAAADASSTSIEGITQAFAQVSAVAALANQSMGDTSAALAVLANNGVKGSDAGTSLKTMFLRLMTPMDDAVKALGEVGLSVASFRGADGKMKPLVDIIGTLNGALGGMDQAAKDDIFRRIFGQDAIRAAAILTSSGVDGFNAMTEAMGGALSVGEKYKTLLSGLAGAGSQVMAAMERLAIAISDAVAPAFTDVARSLLGALNWLTSFVRDNPQFVQALARSAIAAITFGGALTGLGVSLRVVSFALGGFIQAGKAIASPFIFITTATQSLGKSLAIVGTQLAAFATRGIASLAQFAAQASAGLAMSAARSGAIATNYFAGTISIMSATIARAAEGNFRAAAIGVQAMARLGVTGATTVLALAGPANQAAGAVLRIGTTAFEAGKTTAAALTVATGGAFALAKSATQATTALAVVGTTATTTGTLTLASIGKSIAATLTYTATSISSAAATAAAWAAANVPLLALVGIAGGAIFALSQLFKVSFELGSWMREGFAGAVADAGTVFADLKRIATDTFSAVSDAMASGDMSMAMKIGMDGVVAAFARGANALMSKVDGLSADILNTLDAFSVYAANPMLGVMAATGTDPEIFNNDPLIKALRERQDARLNAVNEKDAGRKQGVAGLEQRVADGAAMAAAKRADKELSDATSERLASAKNAADVDLARQQLAGLLERGNLTADAEQRLADEFNKRWEEMSRGPAAAVAAAMPGGLAGPEGLSPEAYSISTGINAANNLKELGKFGKQISDLIESDKISAEQEQYLLNAYRDAQNRIAEQDRLGMGQPQSQAEVVGTFSSVGLGGLGFGGSLVQKIAEYGKRTAEATEKMAEEGAEVQD